MIDANMGATVDIRPIVSRRSDGVGLESALIHSFKVGYRVEVVNGLVLRDLALVIETGNLLARRAGGRAIKHHADAGGGCGQVTAKRDSFQVSAPQHF